MEAGGKCSIVHILWRWRGIPTHFCEVVGKRPLILARVEKVEKNREGGDENEGVRGSGKKSFCEVLADKGIGGGVRRDIAHISILVIVCQG